MINHNAYASTHHWNTHLASGLACLGHRSAALDQSANVGTNAAEDASDARRTDVCSELAESGDGAVLRGSGRAHGAPDRVGGADRHQHLRACLGQPVAKSLAASSHTPHRGLVAGGRLARVGNGLEVQMQVLPLVPSLICASWRIRGWRFPALLSSVEVLG